MSPKVEKRNVTSADVIAALRQRYPTGAWAFLEQVANGTGYQRQYRWADALAMGLWPSRGMELHGIEVKVSRTDWLRELSNPGKADSIHRYCHRWYVAVSDPDIVKPGELPLNWGLYALNGGGKMECRTEAFCSKKPEPLDLLMVAAILRGAAQVGEGQLKAAHEAGYSAGRGDERKRQEQNQGYAVEAVERKRQEQNQGYAVEAVEQLKKSVATFEEKSGIRIDRYSGGRLGEAVAAFMQIRGEHHARAVEHSIESCSRSMDALKAFRAALGEMEKATVPDTC
jgi:hypothetical protein